MENKIEVADIELITIIVNYGIGSKILKSAKTHGIHGGTITLARGTASSHILDFLGLSDIRKEIVYMITDKETAAKALEELNHEFKFCKPNHGIAYTTTICSTIGSRLCKNGNVDDERGEESIMYQVITVIVDKGKAEDVIEAARKAGSKGGTIINARGAGLHETSKLFSMDIEPEKEIVLILTETETTDGILSAIREGLHIEEPGKGLVFVQNVNQTYGLIKK